MVLNEGGEGEVIEEVREQLPHVRRAVLSHAFVVEAIDLRDLSRFVIASQDVDALGIADFETYEHGHGFNGVVSPIYVVSHEEVVRVRSRPADPVELHEVVPLAVDVAADGDGCCNGLDVGLVH